MFVQSTLRFAHKSSGFHTVSSLRTCSFRNIKDDTICCAVIIRKQLPHVSPNASIWLDWLRSNDVTSAPATIGSWYTGHWDTTPCSNTWNTPLYAQRHIDMYSISNLCRAMLHDISNDTCNSVIRNRHWQQKYHQIIDSLTQNNHNTTTSNQPSFCGLTPGYM